MDEEFDMTGSETPDGKFQIKYLEHLGLIAGICDELGLVQSIDDELGSCGAQDGKLSHGERVKIMLMDRLGPMSFTFRRHPDSFEYNPLQILLNREVSPNQ